jgi:hypothetical protein
MPWGQRLGSSLRLRAWLAERGEFELPVPICEQSDDSLGLSFAESRRTANRYRLQRISTAL